ncbi:putative oxidoreductase [Medicago truncatula]|uniref:Putative oxidoreductase n=1 Tax=Medicago truncatula TaxID=3880 RepID=A0A396IH95_MEDTR|nr:putative oxidoreductase [Medicago truncatula]
MSTSYLDKVREVTKEFFALPVEEKQNETLEEFSTKVKSIIDCLLRSMARSLNLEEDSFLDLFGKQSLVKARINFYPPGSRPDLVLGVKPHTDRPGITILLQAKEVEGLQVLIDDKCINVPSIPDALVVNLGDQLEIMSNGIFKCPMLRVVTNTKKLRMSVVIFNEPEPENEIGPVEDLINETYPRLYRNVKNYCEMNYKTYQEGKIYST